MQCILIPIVADTIAEPGGEFFLADIDLPIMGRLQRGTPGQIRVNILGKDTCDLAIIRAI